MMMLMIGDRQSSLPVYKQKQIALSSMHWKCCPGYGGYNCLEKGNISPGTGLDTIVFTQQKHLYLKYVRSMAVALQPL